MIDHIQLISVGDMIEAINGQSLLGCRHYEVARLLKELPRGRTFTLKLTEPRKAFGEGLPPIPAPCQQPSCSCETTERLPETPSNTIARRHNAIGTRFWVPGW